MNTILNEWNFLAERFNTHKHLGEVHPDAAVNIHVGWPVFIQILDSQAAFLGKKSLDILDFGCGAGELCKKFHNLGHKVIGTDNAECMLKLAGNHIPKQIPLHHTSEIYDETHFPEYDSKFDVITAMHVFDWIEDVEKTINKLSKFLKKDGLILFAVFPKKHIIDSLKIKDLFEDFDSAEDPHVGYANFDGIRVLTYVREACFYDKYFEKKGFDKVLEYYPPYSKYFLKTYNWTGSLYSEMMILAYRKL